MCTRGVACAIGAIILLSIQALPVASQEDSAPGYHVGAGDVLAVDAFQHQDITGEFPVEENGAITFPMLGTVPVAGKTTAQISVMLERLLEEDFYVDVQLHVEVREFRSKPVTILGEVQRPGTYYLEGHTTVTQLLADAGGLTSKAGPVLELRRIETVDGRPEPAVYSFATAKLMTGEVGVDIDVLQGDVLSVSAKELYFITGEVARPGQYEISRGMTLMQALSQAGGQGKFASQTVELHREVGAEKEILTFDLSHIRKGRTPDPSVQSGDVIIVRRRFF